MLPGGRKWYKPRDAYNEDFIAETIIHQSEVLVGTTIGYVLVYLTTNGLEASKCSGMSQSSNKQD